MDLSVMSVEMVPTTASQLANDLRSSGTGSPSCILLDIRPNGQFCAGHIKSAENVNFSSIILRRLLKRVVKVESMITSPELSERVCGRSSDTRLVLYDGSSSVELRKAELVRHAAALCRSSGDTVYFLDGGFATFSAQFPRLCVQSPAVVQKSPVKLSVSASLPLSSWATRQPSPQQTQRTPLSRDSSENFGPPVELLPYLVLGCAKDSANVSLLRQLGVTAILNVSHNCPNHFESLFEYKAICVEDSHNADLLSKLDSAIEFVDYIKAKQGCVFVHCHAGISRSATVCIAYAMKLYGEGLASAYDFVKSKRPCISPNLHFMGQLVTFGQQLQDAALAPLPHSGSQGSPSNDEHTLMLAPDLPMDVEQSLTPSALRCFRTMATHCEPTCVSVATDKPKSSSAPSCLDLPSRPSTLSLAGSASTPPNKLSRHWSHGGSTSWCSGPAPRSISLPGTPISLRDAAPAARSRASLRLDIGGERARSARLSRSLQLSSPCRVVARLGDRSSPMLVSVDVNAPWTA